MYFGKWLRTGTLLVGLSFLLGGCASVSQTSTPATLDKLLREKPNLGAFMGPYNSLGNLRIEVNRHLKEAPGEAS